MLLIRLVTYLYEYRNGIKGTGAGFLKLDSRGNDCRVQLYLQGKNVGEDRGMVYFVVRRDELIGIPLGEVTVRQGTIGGSWIVDCESICGSPWSFSDVEGMAVLYPSGRYLAGCWIEEPDEDFLRGNFKPWSNCVSQGVTEQNVQLQMPEGYVQEEQESEKQMPEARVPEEQMPEEQESEEQMPNSNHLEQVKWPEQAEQPQGQTEHAEELQEQAEQTKEQTEHAEKLQEQAERPQEQAEETPEAEKLQQLAENLESDLLSTTEIDRSSDRMTERIDISDIRRFPKKNWHLCSNSFVIHGFFNYHYLVCVHRQEEGKDRQYLGVPGVYAKPERAIAMLFGFPEFEPLQDQNIKVQWNDAEEVPEGTFGYWCCKLMMQ